MVHMAYMFTQILSNVYQTVPLLTHSPTRCRFVLPWGMFERCSQEIGLLSLSGRQTDRSSRSSRRCEKCRKRVGSRQASGLARGHPPRTNTSQHPRISSKCLHLSPPTGRSEFAASMQNARRSEARCYLGKPELREIQLEVLRQNRQGLFPYLSP